MVEKLKEMLDTEPFIPFRIVVTSGGSYDVHSPYQVAVGETRFDYFFPKSDRDATVRINQIVAFDALEDVKR